MDAWIDIRLKARECHLAALQRTNGNRNAVALLQQALEKEDLQLQPFESGSIADQSLLGFLDRPAKMVYVRDGQEPEERVVVIAHEIGHYHLHPDPRNEVRTIAPGLGGDEIDSGAGRVQGYSSRERKELQADVFAGEFLCPSDWLRTELLSGKRPSTVAKELGLPHGLVMKQAVRAFLLPPLRPPADSTPAASFELDESQKEAATWESGPLLVDAGPGTGKTRTLVNRVQHLLDRKVPPASILALTFSNKAAEEMRERLSVANPAAAIEMWVGTFHLFGLELVSKYHDRIGRTPNLRIVDEAGSLEILEKNLERLPLRHFQNLYEPAYELAPVLRAISRCKDELISPQAYGAAAREWEKTAPEAERENAAKAAELAAIYEIYEESLKQADAVDFGDLVMLAADLLTQHADIREEYQRTFEHVLVDEYQDVNTASSRLLRALCKPGSDIWVVADQRQSIYRFRGAQPTNVQRFETEFTGQTKALKFNYRSGEPVVSAFQAFASRMKIGIGGTWTPQRGNVGGVSHVSGPTIAEEAEAIRDHIEDARTQGIPYSDQVILARSHLTLARITGALERLGVPLLYLGDVFERPEVRDLLSLLSIDAESGGLGLLRVAGFAEYGVAREDVLRFLAWSEEHKATSLIQALARAPEVNGLSPQGVAGLGLLGRHLDGIGPGTSPWVVLTNYLFERSAYLTPMVGSNDGKARQQLIAIYQLLKICGEMDAAGHSTRRRFLGRIRRIEALNDDRMYRVVSSEASDLDAVRVMTIHGSKGLEFRAVHLPALATSYMPSNRQGIRCPAPPSLTPLAPADHDAEEECLFFVALSRARDRLLLSRADTYTSRPSKASRFLATLQALAPEERRQSASITPDVAPKLKPVAPLEKYTERELSLYLQCPARYRHESLEGWRGSSDATPYVRFHRCVYRTIGWLEVERGAGRMATLDGARAQLANEWSASGPTAHGYNNYYRSMAEAMVATMVDVVASEAGTYDRSEWDVLVNGKVISILPDRVIVDAAGTIHVQRIRTGRKSKSEAANRIYALLRQGARARYPGRTIEVETLYVATRETVPVPPGKDDKLLGEYLEAIEGIESGNFIAAPEDTRRCPNCQCYFICNFVNGVS